MTSDPGPPPCSPLLPAQPHTLLQENPRTEPAPAALPPEPPAVYPCTAQGSSPRTSPSPLMDPAYQ